MNEHVLDITKLSSDQTKKLNAIAESSRCSYTSFIDKLSEFNLENEFWWITPLVSRESSQCEAFYNYCVLRLIIDELNCNRLFTKVVVPNKTLKKALRRNGVCKQRIEVKEDLKGVLKRCFSGVYKKYVLKKIKKRVDIIKRNVNTVELPDEEKFVLVDTYFIPSQFASNKYKDRYFEGLSQYCDENIVFFGQLEFIDENDGITLAKNVSDLQNTVVFQSLIENNDFNKVKEYMESSKDFNLSNCKWENLNLYDIVYNAVVAGECNSTAIYGVLKGIVIERIISNYNISKIVGWYEGQPSSNGLFARARKVAPSIPTIAYEYTPCPENNIGMYPSKLQNKEKKVAEYYAVGGYAWLELVKQFDIKTKCAVAPDFRHGNIKIVEQKKQSDDVIIILSGVYEIAVSQLKCSIAELIEKGYKRVYIKNHPVYDKYDLRDYGIEIREDRIEIRFVGGLLEDAIRNIGIAIISESSTSLELLLQSINLINFVPPGKLSSVCVPQKYMNSVVIAYSSDDIGEALEYYKSATVLRDNLSIMRENVFEKVNQKSVNSMFILENYS